MITAKRPQSRGIVKPLFTAEKIGDLEIRKTLVNKGLIQKGKLAPAPLPTDDEIRKSLLAAGLIKPRQRA